MSSSEWEAFCNNVDGALKPLIALRKIAAIRIFYFGFYLLLVIIMITIALVKLNVSKLVIIVMWVVASFAMIFSYRSVRNEGEKIVEDLEKVLTEEGRKLSNITFHANHVWGFYTKTYDSIECTVTGVNEEPITIIPVAAPLLNATLEVDWIEVNAAPAVTGRGESTAATRLRELESIKELISEDEYNLTRNSILAAI